MKWLINKMTKDIKSLEELPVWFKCLVPSFYLDPKLPLSRRKCGYQIYGKDAYMCFYRGYWKIEIEE